MKSANTDIFEPGQPKVKRARPDSAKGDRQYMIKVNNSKADKQNMLSERRKVGSESKTNFVDPTMSPGLDELFSRFDEKVIVSSSKKRVENQPD